MTSNNSDSNSSVVSDYKELKLNSLWCIHNVMSKEECNKIIQQGSEGGIHTTRAATSDKRHRNCNTFKFEDSQLASTLYERIKYIIPQEYNISQNDDGTISPSQDGFKEDSIQSNDLVGTWTPHSINTKFSLLYYEGGGHFGPHRDAYTSLDEDVRSMLTFSIYLTDRPTSPAGCGATNFLKDSMDIPEVDDLNRIRAPKDSIEVTVEADRAGKAIIFQHDLLHEGGAISEDGPPKWLLLTQVLYQRDADSAPKLTQNQRLARAFLRQAEQAEIQGKITEAIKFYNKAYKLDPTLE